jgi:hypothetical protein
VENTFKVLDDDGKFSLKLLTDNGVLKSTRGVWTEFGSKAGEWRFGDTFKWVDEVGNLSDKLPADIALHNPALKGLIDMAPEILDNPKWFASIIDASGETLGDMSELAERASKGGKEAKRAITQFGRVSNYMHIVQDVTDKAAGVSWFSRVGKAFVVLGAGSVGPLISVFVGPVAAGVASDAWSWLKWVLLSALVLLVVMIVLLKQHKTRAAGMTHSMAFVHKESDRIKVHDNQYVE